MRQTYYEDLAEELRAELESAVECLREIARLKTVSKRQRINCELAITWLTARGYPLEPDGYVPGVGFKGASSC